MNKENTHIDNLTNDVLKLIDKAKELCEEKHPLEYKIILQSLTTISKELNNIRIKPFKIETDENSTRNNDT